jgi:DNA-binding transcriptional regulator YiaG
MLDFAVYELNYEISDFFSLFLSSGVAKRFEQGDFAVLVGMSGVELAYEVLERSGISVQRRKPKYAVDRSEEYWVGWALAYYQWETALSFEEITKYIPIREIQALYTPYHEMDIRQFVDHMNQLYRAAKPETNLKLIRQRAELSQRQLSELSSVPVRTIQQYEQRQKSINKAQAEYLVMLAQALCCEVGDLLEKVD